MTRIHLEENALQENQHQKKKKKKAGKSEEQWAV